MSNTKKILVVILVIFTIWFSYKVFTTMGTDYMFETYVYSVNIVGTRDFYYAINGRKQHDFRVDVVYDSQITQAKMKVYKDYCINPFTGNKFYFTNNDFGFKYGYHYKLILPINFKIN